MVRYDDCLGASGDRLIEGSGARGTADLRIIRISQQLYAHILVGVVVFYVMPQSLHYGPVESHGLSVCPGVIIFGRVMLHFQHPANGLKEFGRTLRPVIVEDCLRVSVGFYSVLQ